MRKRGRILFGILGIMTLALLAFQTPLLSTLRAQSWDMWVRIIAQVMAVGAIRVQPDVTDQLLQLRVENIRLNTELKRFERLERQLGVPALDTFRSVNALVGSQPIDRFRAQYFLNRGTEDGVILNAPVVSHGSILVGFVTELAPKSSVMQLLFHPATNVPVELSSPEDESSLTRGLLQGHSYTGVTLTTIPRDHQLEPGMVIVTTADQTTTPAGLVIGMVGTIQSTEQDAYQQANVNLPHDPADIEAVSILIPEKGDT